MFDERSTANRLKHFAERAQYAEGRYMYTGKLLPDGSITLSGAAANKVWVRAEEDSREETQVWGTAQKVNLRVFVKPNAAGELAILEPDFGASAYGGQDGVAGALLPPITPENVPNLLIDGRQFRPGRLRYSTLGGLYVYIEGFHYPGGYWPGGDFLMTVPSTASQQAWCAVALNPADGTLSQVTGTEYPLTFIMTSTEAGEITFTNGYIPCGAIVLYNGQTEIDGSEKIDDLRYHFGQAGSDITGFVTLTPDSDTRNTVQPSGDHPALILKNNAAQADNIFEHKNSSGTNLTYIAPTGNITAPAVTATTLDINGDGTIRKMLTDASTELTIASGAVTVTQTFHRIDTEADAASDDLATINGGTDGQFLVIRAENTAREVVVTTAGNITTSDGNSVSLDEVYKFLLLIYDGNRSKWNVVGGGGSGAPGSYYQTIRDAGTPMTQRGKLNFIEGTDITLTIADDSGNDETDVTIAYSGGGASNSPYSLCQGRLTLTSATPVTTSDVTAAGTLYFTPHNGNQVGLYTGAAWTIHTLSELSVSLSGLLPYSIHDVFLDYNGGTPVLALNAWTAGTSGSITGATNATPISITSTAHGLATNDIVTISGVGGNTAANGIFRITNTGADTFTLQNFTGTNVAGSGAYTSGGNWYKADYSPSRATALTTQDGVYVLTGATDWRYLGTIRITGTAAQTEDSAQLRFVWNCYNRVARQLFKCDGTASWTYNTNSFRFLRNDAANYVAFTTGLQEDAVPMTLWIRITSTGSGNHGTVAMTEYRAGTATQRFARVNEALALARTLIVTVNTAPFLGYGKFYAEEIAQAGTITLYGAATDQALSGVVFA